MRRVGKDFSSRETPLFPTMMAKQHSESRRKVTKVPQPSDPTSVADESVNEEMGDSLERAATSSTSLDAEQDRGVNTPQSEEDSLKRNELMELMYQVTKKAVNKYLLHNKMRKLLKKEVDAAQVQVTTATTTPTISIDEVTLAQALTELKHIKPKAKAKGIVFHEPKESTTTTTTIPKSKSQDKGKAKMIEEPVKLKKKDQIQIDEEVSLKLQAELQAEFEKEQIHANERAQQEEEVYIALIESWDDVQAKIDADYQLAEILQAEEQQELNDEEKATLFTQLLKKRKKFFAAKRAE
nr:hypothetical protein [Tanacetum cinerariifolium]